MNERIKELAKQAEKLSLKYANKNNINFVDAFNIVFAKLIVMECVQVVNEQGSDVLYEQFGVEESDVFGVE